MPTPNRIQRCDYCRHSFDPGERRLYVYPVPAPERTSPFEGRMACEACFPEAQRRQIDQGLLMRLEG